MKQFCFSSSVNIVSALSVSLFIFLSIIGVMPIFFLVFVDNFLKSFSSHLMISINNFTFAHKPITLLEKLFFYLKIFY